MVLTYKNKFNMKYGFPKDKSHSLQDIAKISGYDVNGLQTVFNKGIGAYKTNPQSVRPTVRSPEQWAYSRVYSAVMGGKAMNIDKPHLIFV
jgi:hypothetical protein